MTRTTRKSPKSDDPAASYTMTRLDEVRALADPLRVRILEKLGDAPRTTKQVAELLGEKPTRLYHHVEALAKAGLVRLTETRPVRGTVEKYYRAVALAYRADSSLFRQERAGDAEREVLTGVVTSMLERTADEMRELIRSGHDTITAEEGILSYFEVRGSEGELRTLRAKLKALLEQVERKSSCGALAEGSRRYRLTLAFYPLDVLSRPRKGSRPSRPPRTPRR